MEISQNLLFEEYTFSPLNIKETYMNMSVLDKNIY